MPSLLSSYIPKLKRYDYSFCCQTGELRPKFDAVEVFALMAACLCHDLDHRGTNNAFQVKLVHLLSLLIFQFNIDFHANVKKDLADIYEN